MSAPIRIGADGDDPFRDDLELRDDIDIMLALADCAAQGMIGSYEAEDWRRSPFGRPLAMVASRTRAQGRDVPPAVDEALEQFGLIASGSA